MRCFIAVVPPPAVLAALAELPRPVEPGVRWTRPGTWHVTLRFLGDTDPAEVSRAMDALAGRHDPPGFPGPVEAELGPAVARLGRHVVCVPVHGLADLAAVVGEATAHLGAPPDPRPFAGHITLARLRARAACGVAGAPVRARFAVTEVVLFSSVLDREGPTHTALRGWPVGGPP